MADAIIPFEFEGVSIRVLTDEAGEPWWIASDVCSALGYANPRDAVAKHVDPEDCNTVAIRDGIRGNPNHTVINESGVYSLILRSDKPEAKRFKRLVTSVILPAVRKTGSYVAPASKRIESAEARERRLLAREERLSRQLARDGLHDFIRLAGDNLTPEARQAVAAKIAEVSTGEPMPMLLPANREPDWVAPAQIAERTGRSLNAVGRVISELGLRGKDGMSKAITNVAKGTHRPVPGYLYSPEAVALIVEALAGGTTSPGGEA